MKKIEHQDTKDLNLFQQYITEEQHTKLLTWIEALESGNYYQGQGKLESLSSEGGTKYCCLGVANKVCNLGVPSYFGTLLHFHMLGLRDEIGTFGKGDDQDTLVSLNDGYDWTFIEIANLLKDQLKFVEVGVAK